MPSLQPPIASLDEAAFLTALQLRYGTLPAAVLAEPDLLALYLPPLRADLRLHEAYLTTVRAVSCGITAFAGIDDDQASPSAMGAWAAYSESAFRLRPVESGHFFSGSVQQEVLSVVERELHEARRPLGVDR
jgi:medium-chain acyl-[acyl-carrier-protein] hydrolase